MGTESVNFHWLSCESRGVPRYLRPTDVAVCMALVLALRCPVLTWHMALCADALGTRCLGLTQRMLLSAYARAMRCPVLTHRALLLPAYALAKRCPVLT
eukprot:928831-Rhodomonas_salina.5